VKISVSRSAALRESAGSQDHMQITIEVVIFHIATSPANAGNSSAKMIISVKKRENAAPMRDAFLDGFGLTFGFDLVSLFDRFM
jgi:hypothetical protein